MDALKEKARHIETINTLSEAIYPTARDIAAIVGYNLYSIWMNDGICEDDMIQQGYSLQSLQIDGLLAELFDLWGDEADEYEFTYYPQQVGQFFKTYHDTYAMALL